MWNWRPSGASGRGIAFREIVPGARAVKRGDLPPSTTASTSAATATAEEEEEEGFGEDSSGDKRQEGQIVLVLIGVLALRQADT